MLDRKTSITWKRFLFSLPREGNSKKPLPRRVKKYIYQDNPIGNGIVLSRN